MLFKSLLISLSVILVAMVPQDDKNVDAKTTIDVKVIGDGHSYTFVHKSDGPRQWNIDGEVIELDGVELEVGESRNYETEKGTVTISRSEEGLLLTDYEGEEIRIMDEMVENGHMVIETMEENGVHVFSLESLKEDGITISGLEGLGENIQERVREALRSAGVDENINFKDNHIVWVDEDGIDANVTGNMVFVTKEGSCDTEGDVEVETRFKVIKKDRREHRVHKDIREK